MFAAMCSANTGLTGWTIRTISTSCSHDGLDSLAIHRVNVRRDAPSFAANSF